MDSTERTLSETGDDDEASQHALRQASRREDDQRDLATPHFEVRLVSPQVTASSLPPELRALAVSQAADVCFQIPWDEDEERLVTLVSEAQTPTVTVGLLDPGFALVKDPQLAVIALFPSGATRTVGTARLIEGSWIVLAFFDYWSLLDPDDTESRLGETIAGNARVVAIYPEGKPS